MSVFGSGKFQYKVVDNWAKKGGWGERRPFTDVAGVGVDSRDRVYVLNRSTHPVMVFDRDGNFIRSWGEGVFTRAHGVFIDKDDTLWCTDDVQHTVRRFDTSGNLLQTLGTPNLYSDTGYDGRNQGSIKRACDAPPFNRPTKAVVSSTGEIFVTDGYGNARVHKFSKEGRLLLSWGEPGTSPGQFVCPHSLALDSRGNVYVADRENRRIQVFNTDGKLITIWNNVQRPDDVAVVDDSYLFVAELENRVSIWDLHGKILAHWGGDKGQSNDAGYFMSPHAIAVDSRRALYVGEVCDTNPGYDRGSRAVQKFIPLS